MKFSAYVNIILFFLVCPSLHAQGIQSPDGNFELHFTLTDSVPAYALDFKGQPLIKKSRLGFELSEQKDLMNGFERADAISILPVTDESETEGLKEL